ncbi:hypothetical protein NDU88_002629, partial [Pleurodeles waltl]
KMSKNNKKNNGLSRREAMFHDSPGLKSFWEKRIEKHSVLIQGEDFRNNKSAL